MSTLYAKMINQKIENQTVFLARFDRKVKDDQVLDEIELYLMI